MEIKKSASAGTMESSDAYVEVEPAHALTVELQSVVQAQFGEAIESTVRDVLAEFGIADASVQLLDKGALDCTLKARVECAVFRSCDKSAAGIPWGGVIK